MNIKQNKTTNDIRSGSRHHVLDLRKKHKPSLKNNQKKIKNRPVDQQINQAINFLDQLQSSSQTTLQSKIIRVNHSSLSKEEKQWLLKKLHQSRSQVKRTSINYLRSRSKANSSLSNNTNQINKNISPISLVPKIRNKKRKRRKINYKLALSALTIIFLLILLIKLPTIISQGHSLYQKIIYSKNVINQEINAAKSSIKNDNLLAASQSLDQIQNNLEQIKRETNFANSSLVSLLSKLPINSPIIQGQKLIKLGEDLTQFSNDLILSTEAFNTCPVKNIIDTSSTPCLANSLSQSNLALRLAQERVNRLENDFKKINLEVIPSSSRPLLKKIKNNLPQIKIIINQLSQLSSVALNILGEKTPRNYLILFQNPAEIRGSGGFIGSYAQVKIFRGQVKKMKVDDIYNPNGQLIKKFIPVKPLWRFQSNFQLTDANWFADFPSSAQTFSQLFEDCGQSTPDGIIAINPFFIQDLLKLTGPIDLSDYHKVITAQNFFIETQNEVELGPDKLSRHPKKIIAELAPILISKLTNFWSKGTFEQKSKLVNLIWQNLNKKNILIYLPQEKDAQKILSQFNWSGQIKPYLQDYLMVVNNNFLGSKSDWVIKQKIDQKIDIQKDGSIIKTVTITRQHQGDKYPESFFRQKNQDYLTLLVPKGSQLISVSGFDFQSPIDEQKLYAKFESLPIINKFNNSFQRMNNFSNTDIFTENSLTGFGHWTIINPGQTKTFSFTYRLPFKINQKYTLLIQKQSGNNSILTTKIIWPENKKLAWFKPIKNISVDQNKIKFRSDLNQDQTFGIVFK